MSGDFSGARGGLSLVRLICLSAGACACVCVCACSTPSKVRIERGPLLRSFTRAEVLEGGFRLEAQVEWPILRLEVTSFDICRELSIDEYAEQEVTQARSPLAGPAFWTGVASLAAGAALWGTSWAVSDQPNTELIDLAGHYGPSARQSVRAWAIGAATVGVPALAAGLLAMLRSSEVRRELPAEEVRGHRDQQCHQRPVQGPVELQHHRQPVASSKELVEGRVTYAAVELGGPVSEVHFFGRKLELDAQVVERLAAFGTCALVLRAPHTTPEALDDRALQTLAERLRACRSVQGNAVESTLEAVESELRRRESERPADAPLSR